MPRHSRSEYDQDLKSLEGLGTSARMAQSRVVVSRRFRLTLSSVRNISVSKSGVLTKKIGTVKDAEQLDLIRYFALSLFMVWKALSLGR